MDWGKLSVISSSSIIPFGTPLPSFKHFQYTSNGFCTTQGINHCYYFFYSQHNGTYGKTDV